MSRVIALSFLLMAGTGGLVWALGILEAEQPQPNASPKGGPFAPVVRIRHDDYANARRTFRSKLLRKGPSPQKGSAGKPPPGVSEVEYLSGALRLHAWLSKARPGPSPAVLFLHGGFAFEPDDWDVSQPFRDAGFVVMTPLFRAEDDQPGAFSFFYDEVDDALAAGDLLARQPGVKKDEIFIAGPSAGGTVALLAAMTSKQFRAAATFSASPDQVLFCRHAKHAARDVPVNLQDLAELEMRSPLAFAESLKCPARIYFGTQEPHFRQTSERLATLARERGLDVEAIAVKGDHGSAVAPAIRQSIEFFRKR
jgi:dipeptidyl aminopeptidase/acylaminoacyl peptidase